MCSLFGSYNRGEFRELAKLNSYRGTHSHSVARYHPDKGLEIVAKDFGPMKDYDLDPLYFYLGHQQAPTTDNKDTSSIHPANLSADYLWHNGIIKDYQVKKWQSEGPLKSSWDTMWLLHHLQQDGIDAMSQADGSFACVWYKNEINTLRLFRNDNCPLYIKGTSFSSTKFKDSISIKVGSVYQLSFQREWYIIPNMEFKTKELFYWSPE